MSDAGDLDGALAKYREALELDLERPSSAWNLAIAATALRDWSTARAVWGALGITIPPGDGPTDDSFGVAPVRLNPEEDPEVVWARRVYPCPRAIDKHPCA